MDKLTKYLNKPAFINRKSELDYLGNWIHSKPNDILFLYGPKSSGKTTLLNIFILKHMNNKNFNIKHFNLREMLIANYSDFIKAFFEIDYSKSTEGIKQKREYNIKLFKLSKKIIKSMENKVLDPFVVMKQELTKIDKKGKRPIIIIDELQALEDIYLNGQRDLLKELFNFFVAITKESHLCHVIITSSDGYFMNRIYNDSKLTKTSSFLEINYLNESDVRSWLSNLEQNSAIKAYVFSDEQIDAIIKYFGGSVWEISFLLAELIPYAKNKHIKTKHVLDRIDRLIEINKGKFKRYAGLHKDKIQLFYRIFHVRDDSYPFEPFEEYEIRSLVSEGIYEINELRNELNNLVRLNFLAFNPTTSTYQLQGNSMVYGLKNYVEGIPEDLLIP
ncbi:ATP-binding protein [Candidatus Magnetomorum sp. HK-1]|nr:ATP-binding protein [Candidatus Magnetomorum sp. HK-1]